MDKPRVGDEVVGPSLSRVGRVVEVAGDLFLLAIPDGTRLWLSPDTIFTVDGGLITLICERGHVRDYQVRPPRDERSA